MPIALIDCDLVEEIGHYWIGNNGYPVFKTDILIHRYIAEKALGRPLKDRELVHHIDGNKLNNKRTNLLICQNDSYHMLIHARTDMVNDGYSPETHQYCSSCKEYHIKELFPKSINNWNGVHNMCKEATNKARRGKGYSKFTWRERLAQQYRRVFSQYTKRGLCSILKEGRSL